MKKYLLIFLSCITILLLPNNVFAKEISEMVNYIRFDNDMSGLVIKCENSNSCSNQISFPNAIYIDFNIEPLINKRYTLNVFFKLISSSSELTVNTDHVYLDILGSRLFTDNDEPLVKNLNLIEQENLPQAFSNLYQLTLAFNSPSSSSLEQLLGVGFRLRNLTPVSGFQEIIIEVERVSLCDSTGSCVESETPIEVSDTDKIIDNENKNHQESQETQKGIWGTIKDLLSTIVEIPKKIVDFLVEALKMLFIPDEDIFDNFLTIKDKFLEQLGFLTFPAEVVIDFLNKYINLGTNPVINIPDIKEPLSGHILISARTFNIEDIFTYGSIGTLYNFYKVFSSFFVLVIFLNFCIRKYNDFIKARSDDNL